MYINEALSYLNVAENLHIKNKTQIIRWVTVYRNKGEYIFAKETHGKSKTPRKGK